MHLRPIERGDIPAVSSVFLSARDDSKLFDFLCPRRKEYPEAFRAQNVAAIHRNLLDPEVHGLVCVTDAEDAATFAKRPLRDVSGNPVPEGTILGSCWWSRHSTLSKPRSCDTLPLQRNSWFESLERLLRRVESWYVDNICPNPSVSKENHAEYAHAARTTGSIHLKGRVSHWVLVGLGVHTDFQGCGAGRRMVQWGLDQAQAEWDAASEQERAHGEVAKAITLIAVPQGQPLYKKMGFERVGDERGPFAFGLPNSDESYWYMIWDPMGQWTRKSDTDEGRYLVYL